jgi:hypothetical protein
MTTSVEFSRPEGAILYDLLRIACDSYDRETRREMRYAFYQLVTIRSGEVEYDGFSRDISPTGIGLMHQADLPLEQVDVVLSTENTESVSLRVQIEWCRPLGQGWYLSGGKFVAVNEF